MLNKSTNEHKHICSNEQTHTNFGNVEVEIAGVQLCDHEANRRSCPPVADPDSKVYWRNVTGKLKSLRLRIFSRTRNVCVCL